MRSDFSLNNIGGCCVMMIVFWLVWNKKYGVNTVIRSMASGQQTPPPSP